MPTLHYGFEEPLTANIIQSLIFGLAHFDGSTIPIIQILMGFYFGHLLPKKMDIPLKSLFFFIIGGMS